MSLADVKDKSLHIYQDMRRVHKFPGKPGIVCLVLETCNPPSRSKIAFLNSNGIPCWL